jgi:N-acyl-phosphatidylethanolamine-hydrolysing phospholipase D
VLQDVVSRRRLWRLSAVLILALAAVGAFGLDVRAAGINNPSTAAPRVAGRFRNPGTDYSYSMLDRARKLFVGPHRPKPTSGLATLRNDGAYIRSNGHVPSVTWIGHSTFLLQIGGLNVLTDPHWGEMTSPVSFAGPRRLIRPGIAFEDLPQIHAVVISHDHYDHLDEATVLRLAREHRPKFYVPLGVGAWLAERGVDGAIEMDWWQKQVFRGVTFVCTPAQHSSGRYLHDQNKRLWSSWVLHGGGKKVFFAGDTGYNRTLRDIGKLGPFDLVLMPVGGYSGWQRHHPNHVSPEEAVQLFEDVGGKVMVPMHWGTFDLNREPPNEPPGRVLAEALRRGIEERMAILSPGQTINW